MAMRGSIGMMGMSPGAGTLKNSSNIGFSDGDNEIQFTFVP